MSGTFDWACLSLKWLCILGRLGINSSIHIDYIYNCFINILKCTFGWNSLLMERQESLSFLSDIYFQVWHGMTFWWVDDNFWIHSRELYLNVAHRPQKPTLKKKQFVCYLFIYFFACNILNTYLCIFIFFFTSESCNKITFKGNVFHLIMENTELTDSIPLISVYITVNIIKNMINYFIGKSV